VLIGPFLALCLISIYLAVNDQVPIKIKVRNSTLYVIWCGVALVLANLIFAIHEIRILIFVVICSAGIGLARFVDRLQKG